MFSNSMKWFDQPEETVLAPMAYSSVRSQPMMAPTPSAVSWPAPSVRLRLCWPASPASASSMFIGFFTKSQLRGSLAPVASSSFDLVAIRKAPRRTHLASYKLILGCLFGRRRPPRPNQIYRDSNQHDH